MDAVHLIAATLLSGVLGLERKAFLQAMLSRPLVAGALVGIALDRSVEGLAIGAGLELFFLGAVNLGAALPDNELFTTVAAAGCACALASRTSLPMPATLACAVLVTLPAGKVGKATDRLSERLNGLVMAVVEGEGDAQRIRTRLRHNLYGMWIPFAATAATFLAGSFLGSIVLPPALARLAPAMATLPRGLSLVWAAFLVVGAAAAVRTARTSRAFFWAAASAVLAAGVQAAKLLEGR